MSPKRCCAKICFNAQINNRAVSYFAFPKNEFYAHKWAIAAGREDLTKKSLQSLSKYWLCSEHFTAECFVDSPANTKLKKKTRPVIVPIPTIFENNLNKFMSKSCEKNEPNIKDNGCNSDATGIDRDQNPKFYTVDDDPTMILVIPELLTIKPDSNRGNASYIEGSYISDVQELVEKDDDCEDNLEEDETLLCRLCAIEFESGQLAEIFANSVITECVKFVLPGQIEKHDGFSQLICVDCFDKARQCFEIINDFRKTQKLFQLLNV